jgi:hypothetical protein
MVIELNIAFMDDMDLNRQLKDIILLIVIIPQILMKFQILFL